MAFVWHFCLSGLSLSYGSCCLWSALLCCRIHRPRSPTQMTASRYLRVRAVHLRCCQAPPRPESQSLHRSLNRRGPPGLSKDLQWKGVWEWYTETLTVFKSFRMPVIIYLFLFYVLWWSIQGIKRYTCRTNNLQHTVKIQKQVCFCILLSIFVISMKTVEWAATSTWTLLKFKVKRTRERAGNPIRKSWLESFTKRIQYKWTLTNHPQACIDNERDVEGLIFMPCYNPLPYGHKKVISACKLPQIVK